MTACRCIEGAVRADRDKRTVECACGRCTPSRLAALEAGSKRLRKMARRDRKAQRIEAARIGRVLLALAAVLGVTLPDGAEVKSKEGAS